MKCTQCGAENREGKKFCVQCGARLALRCPKCSAPYEEGDCFCGECGENLRTPQRVAPAPPPPPKLEEMHAQMQRFIPPSLAERMSLAERELEGENRLVTALFADISGFTPLSQRLPMEAVVEKVNECFKAIVDAVYRYEGNVNRFIGDCALCFFGAPISHENDPERAILAALSMQAAVSQIELSISVGINSGLMYFGPIGTQQHQEFSAYGPDINLAKRLQEAAKPGQILVGPGTYRLTRKAFDFNRLDAMQLKGVKSPVPVYEVLRVKVHPEKLRGIEGLRAQMIGREREFGDLKEAADQWLQGQGQVVSIIGEAGIGKSRLVSELKTYLSSVRRDDLSHLMANGTTEVVTTNPHSPTHSLTWLEGRCVSIGQPISYWPFIDILRAYFGLSEGDSEREVARNVTEGIQKLFPQSSEDLLPFIGHLMSIRFENELDNRLQFFTPEQIRHQTLMRLRDVFVTLAKKQPLLLILEDLHWADDLSLDLVSLLMDELIATPLMLLCVYRPEREHRVWQLSSLAQRKCLDRYTELTLKKLSSRESRQLVESLLWIDNLPESVKEMILRKSEGNPFFIEEVIRSLIDRDIVYREEDRWKAKAEIVHLDVPDTIQSVILTRVDRLKAEAKYVLQCASVIGRLFKYRLLEHLAQQERDLDLYLSEFEERELVYEERTVPELEYAFKHALTQEATYQGILERKRREFHGQVAEGIELLYRERLAEYYEQLAYHYDKSGDVEKAIDYLLKAGEKARKTYLNDEAIGYFQRALEWLDGFVGAQHAASLQKEWRLAALKGLGQVYQGVGKNSEAEGHFRQAIALGREMGLSAYELVRLYFWLGQVLFWQSRYDEMIRIGEEGLAFLDDTESVEAALMNYQIAAGYRNKGDGKWRVFTLRNAQFIQRLPYLEELRLAYEYNVIMYAKFDKNEEEAMKWLKALERVAQQHHDLRALGEAHYLTGWFILGPKGDLRGAISQYQRALELFTKIGDAKYKSWCLYYMGDAFLSLGDLPKSDEFAYRGFEIAGGVGHKRDIAFSYMVIGTLLLCQDSWEKALLAFQKADQLLREITHSWETWATLSLGRAYLAQGERLKALRQFEEALVKTDQCGSSFFLLFILGTSLTDSSILAGALSGLEEAYDDPEAFRAFCRRFREEHPDVGGSSFVQWYLELTEPQNFELKIEDCLLNIQSSILNPQSPWVWNDPFGDCSFTVQKGLEIHAANGRDLWHINLSAPRILRPVSGDFAVQTVITSPPYTLTPGPSPIKGEGRGEGSLPAIGGLLLWKDKENYLRLDKGTRGKDEINFSGCLANKDLIIGRGRLSSERVYLRLERRGGCVNALCSADGAEWFTVGGVEFPVEDPVEVGLHAIGNIDRTIYHGAYPEGTAIRFEAFELWGK